MYRVPAGGQENARHNLNKKMAQRARRFSNTPFGSSHGPSLLPRRALVRYCVATETLDSAENIVTSLSIY